MSYQDFRGNEVRVGSTILYAITKSRSACLVEAEVLEIRPKKEGERGPAFKLHVQPLQDSYGERWSGRTYDPEERRYVRTSPPKAVTLQHTDRFAVIPARVP